MIIVMDSGLPVIKGPPQRKLRPKAKNKYVGADWKACAAL
jgi:hypothetical protein